MKTLVYGLGESGIAATRALLGRGAQVLAADANDNARSPVAGERARSL